MANNLLCAQILSVIAFILSLAGWWLAWVAGLIATIILWIACCCGLPRLVWVAVSVMAVIAAIGEILALAGVVGEIVSTVEMIVVVAPLEPLSSPLWLWCLGWLSLQWHGAKVKVLVKLRTIFPHNHGTGVSSTNEDKYRLAFFKKSAGWISRWFS